MLQKPTSECPRKLDQEKSITPSGPGHKPVYYKGTLPERGSEATVTVSHQRHETVVLKSRKHGYRREPFNFFSYCLSYYKFEI